MNKITLAQVLTKFYSRDVMYHVGQNWKGNGLLFLLGICFYISLFSGYSWSKYIEAKYEEFYQPVLPLLPDATYKDGRFTFDVEQPYKINHPLTQKPAIFINTSKTIKDDEIKNALSEYPCAISKEGVFITNFELPLMPEHYEFYEIFIKPFEKGRGSGFMTFIYQMTSMFSNSGDSKIYTGEELKSYLDVSIKQTVYFTLIIMTIGTFIQEVLKTLMISGIIMLIMRNTRKFQSFSQLMRLCVLSYLPVLLIHGAYKYFMVQPGMIMVIILSITHIVLFMKAVAVNTMDDETEPPKNTDF